VNYDRAVAVGTKYQLIGLLLTEMPDIAVRTKYQLIGLLLKELPDKVSAYWLIVETTARHSS
jgi:hypothetical protein